MNELVNLTALHKLIARESGCDLLFAKIFLEQLISIVKEEVEKGEEVTIEGLGVFRSVCVEKGALRRVVFIPSERLKEGVNAPFVQFEPFQLVAPYKQTIPTEHKVSPLVNKEKAETVVAAELLNKNVLVMKENPETLPREDRSETNEQKEAKTYREEMAEVEGPVQVSDGNGNLTENVDKAIEESVEPEIAANCKDGSCVTSSRISANGMWIWFVIILLAVCVIGGMLYFFLRVDGAERKASKQAFEIQTEQVIPEVAPQTAQQISSDTILESEKTEKVQEVPAPAVKTEPASDSIAEVTLRKGDRLTLLALRFYGNKSFWVYIYDANKLKYPDPNDIPVGARLKIPTADRYGIDAENPNSVKRAKEMAAKILTSK